MSGLRVAAAGGGLGGRLVFGCELETAGKAGPGDDLLTAVGDYETQLRDYGYATVAAARAAEAETGTRRGRLMFWLHRPRRPGRVTS